MSKKSDSKTEIAAAGVSGQAQRLSLFGPPLVLEGEDAAAYDEVFGRICAAAKPVDVIDEMFIDDIVSLEWEVLRWRRLKSTLMQEAGFKALQSFLAGQLDDHLYSERVGKLFSTIFQKSTHILRRRWCATMSGINSTLSIRSLKCSPALI
jgi:hypothetical protein